MHAEVARPAADRLSARLPSRGQAALAIAILSVLILAGATMRLAFSPVQEIAERDLHLTDIQIGLVQGLATSLTIALFSLPLGRLTDRGNRVALLVGLTFVSVLGTVLTAFAPGFWTLFVGRMLAGFGGVCALPVAVSIAADLVMPDRRGRAVLFLQVGQMAGVALAFALGGGLLAMLGHLAVPPLEPFAAWRKVHLVFAAIGIAATLPLALLREPARHEIAESVDIRLRHAIASLWQRRGFVIPLYIGQTTVVMADSAAGIWAAPVLTRDFGLQPADFAGWMGLVLLVSGIVGAGIGGIACDLGLKGRLPGGMLGGAIVASLLAIPAAFFAVSPSLTGFALLLGLLLACGSVTGIVTATAIAVYVPNELRGFCLGIFIVVGSLAGLGLAPALVPVIGGVLGGAHAVGAALAVLSAVTSLIALVGFVGALRHLPRPTADRSGAAIHI